MENRISDQESLEIIKILCSGGFETEEEDDQKIDYLRRFYPEEIINLMFWDKRNLTPNEILEEVKRYQPILL